MREMYPECYIFWIPANKVESLHQAYLELGRQLRIPDVKDEQEDIKKLVQLRLSQENASQWLLIFDKADDIDMWIKKSDNINGSSSLIDFLPRHSKGSIVFTTRSRKIAVKLAQQNVIKVAEMDEDTAIQILSKSLIDKKSIERSSGHAELANIAHFSSTCYCAYINENEITLFQYFTLLCRRQRVICNRITHRRL